MEIYKSFRFDAAHRLTGVSSDHKCAALHGHSFELIVTIEGTMDEKTGFIIDFGDLASICDPLLRRLDHAVLNDIEGLENPTSERMCIWLWNELKPHLPMLSQVELKETATSGCMYRGPMNTAPIASEDPSTPRG